MQGALTVLKGKEVCCLVTTSLVNRNYISQNVGQYAKINLK